MQQSFDDDQGLPPLDTLDPEMAAEFERFGPAAFVDTQTAAQSQWIRDTLDRENDNFLEFVSNAVASRNDELGLDDEGVEFGILLPPEENTHIVAAQGLLHVLTLGTRSLLQVRQDTGYGPIRLQVPSVTPEEQQ